MKLTAITIAKMLNGIVEGDDSVYINKLSKIESGVKNSISFLGNPKYIDYLYSSNSSIIIIDKKLQLERSIKSTLIRVDNPNESFSKLLDHFGKSEVNLKGIDKNSHIDKSVSFHDDLFFGLYKSNLPLADS